MQVVFQDPFGSLSPRMSVQQIISEGLEVHQPSSPEQCEARVIQALEEVGLDPLTRDRYPTNFLEASANASPLPGPWCSSQH